MKVDPNLLAAMDGLKVMKIAVDASKAALEASTLKDRELRESFDHVATVRQAAKYLGVSRSRVYHYLAGFMSGQRGFNYLLQGWKDSRGRWAIPWRGLEGFSKPSGRAGRPKGGS
jgi:hypothetical protein